MVDLDCLAALDGLIWLRTGHQVAARFNCDQSTISRNSKKCAEVFGVSLVRRHSEWCIKGDPALLNLERRVHQVVRWRDGKSLRLEAQYWSGPLLCSPLPDGWIAGNFNFMEYCRPLQLIRERVVDAWIASYPDVPSGDDPELVSIPLSRMPMFLVVREGHPLLELGDRVSFDAVAHYPLLPLPEGAFPAFQKVLQDCGLWSKSVKSSLKGRDNLEDLLVGYSTPLSLPLYGETIRTLPLRIPVLVGEALVVAREYADSRHVRDLASLLRARLEALASTTEEVEVLYPADDQCFSARD